MTGEMIVRVRGGDEFGKFKTVEALLKRRNWENPTQADRRHLARALPPG